MGDGTAPAGADGDAEPDGVATTTAPETFVVRGFLFLASYAPLFAILAVRFEGKVLRIVCAALAAVGLLYLASALVLITRAAQPRLFPVTTVNDASGEVAGYLATYILPFVTIPSPSGTDIAGYCIMAGVVAVIFVQSDLATINPTLYLFGLRVATIESNGTTRHLVCRHPPSSDSQVHAVKVAGLLIRKEP